MLKITQLKSEYTPKKKTHKKSQDTLWWHVIQYRSNHTLKNDDCSEEKENTSQFCTVVKLWQFKSIAPAILFSIKKKTYGDARYRFYHLNKSVDEHTHTHTQNHRQMKSTKINKRSPMPTTLPLFFLSHVQGGEYKKTAIYIYANGKCDQTCAVKKYIFGSSHAHTGYTMHRGM